ncbi:MAG TPA: dUTP diphosphatase [Candidatus Baltobacteraceae bacterium]|jgi:dUTP pyrophosphatase|nr:dUTP diphosphatase [Candidatus Baltobacteraceae bacterium]
MTSAVTVPFKRLPEGEGLDLPSYMTDSAAGADLFAAVREAITLLPGARALIPAGFSIALPRGYEAQIRPRSGLALRAGVTCLNSPGTIDSDYRGPVCVILANFGSEPFVVRRGDRIAQMVIAPVAHARFEIVDDLDETQRSGGGFGSTGVA